MDELTFEDIKAEFIALKEKYLSKIDKESLTSIFVSASKLYLALTSIFLEAENDKDDKMKLLLTQLEFFTDSLHDEITGKYIRLL